jgi:hypothetical protein
MLGGVYFSIYKGSYNESNISFLNLPGLIFELAVSPANPFCKFVVKQVLFIKMMLVVG